MLRDYEERRVQMILKEWRNWMKLYNPKIIPGSEPSNHPEFDGRRDGTWTGWNDIFDIKPGTEEYAKNQERDRLECIAFSRIYTEIGPVYYLDTSY